ncbi:nicotine blue oxidoreductase [Pseudarthrobacter sp. P1]|uniref:nicotine blue oxidoreductase n=1 Tax=Pseudarthrobacter sp. P1 TaxID=3418418 RepID=UPI003CF85AD7
MTTTTAVLLAAGAGTRLGRGPKALLPHRGTTLVAHLAGQLLLGGCREVVVVLGAGAGAVRSAGLPSGCRSVDNPRWAEGMGTSFALGVASAAASDNVLVALVDQPGLGADLVARLLAAHRPGRITAAGFRAGDGVPGHGVPGSEGMVRGHPVLFDARLAGLAAAAASGDAGARPFLRSHPELIDLVDCTDLSDGADVDTPGQLHRLD